MHEVCNSYNFQIISWEKDRIILKANTNVYTNRLKPLNKVHTLMKLNLFFLSTSYENLMKEERLATQEMMAMDKRIESWSQLAPAVPSARSAKSASELASARDITKDLPPEVAVFEVNSLFF